MNNLFARSISTFAVFVLLALPLSAAHAFNPSRWEGHYKGTWVNTYTNDCFESGDTGSIAINLITVETDGTISSATVKFSDGSKLSATGSIYTKKGTRHIRLNYSYDDTTYYLIKGKLNDSEKINGTYLHADSSCAAGWGGTVKAHHRD